MGHGIAQVSATAGYNIVLRDIKQEFLDKAMEKIKWSLDKLVSKEKLVEKKVMQFLQELLQLWI
jgi:3-hydroxyacyl-CoA dehydrogenase